MTKNKMDAVLAQCKAEGKKVLIPYITAGDGGFNLTEKMILEMEKAGADLIVLGVPFSDPIAEAPVVQKASERSLASGTTLAGIMEMMQRIREKTDVPVLLMMYLNTIFRCGKDRFFALCQKCGIDGVLVPDMPFEEKDEIQAQADAYGIHNISLLTTASAGRIRMIAAAASGFLYAVASGKADSCAFLDQVKSSTELPVIAEIDVSDLELALERCKHCDGILISSSVVELVEKHGADAAETAALFVKNARLALDMQ